MNRATAIVLILLWVVSTFFLGIIPEQSEFSLILLFGIGSFVAYWILYKYQNHIPFSYIVIAAVFARIAVIPFFPQLSDDIFRFIWDGRLIHEGFHPYAALPSSIVGEAPGCDSALFEKLNSPNYFSIYPPVVQVIFWISTSVFSLSLMPEVVLMKCIHFIFELGCLGVLYKLLPLVKQPKKRWVLYALNPLIVIETIANVHHEGIMLYFILLTLLLLSHKRFVYAGITIALAIGTKLLPLLLCPFLFFYLKHKARWIFTGTAFVATILIFMPAFIGSGLVENLSNSVELYVNEFEFNGGLYYLLRGWGYVIYDFNIIHVLGPVLRIATILGVLFLAFQFGPKVTFQKVPKSLLLTYLLFVLLSTTVHPWYIILLIGLAPLTNLHFPFIWSGLIMLTYINYSYMPYFENLWIVFIEYSIIGFFIVREVVWGDNTYTSLDS